MAKFQITLNKLLYKKFRYCDHNSDIVISLLLENNKFQTFNTWIWSFAQLKVTISTFYIIAVFIHKVLIKNWAHSFTKTSVLLYLYIKMINYEVTYCFFPTWSFFGYCYRSVNVISLTLSASDHIKLLSLYLVLFCFYY